MSANDPRRTSLQRMRCHHPTWSGPVADPRYEFESLFDDSYVVAAGAQNQWVRRRKIDIAELAKELWALPPRNSVIGSIVTDAFRSRGLDYPRVSVVTDCPHMRVSLLATGRFVTIFPASAFRFLAKRSELKVLPVELPMARRPNGIVTLKNRRHRQDRGGRDFMIALDRSGWVSLWGALFFTTSPSTFMIALASFDPIQRLAAFVSKITL